MTAVAASAAVSAFILTAFAGTWQQDAAGFWWRNDDGSWPAARWEWIDADGDDSASCYYFNEQGYAQPEGVTPDSYELVNDGVAGAWTVDGVIRTAPSAAVCAALVTDYSGSYENPDLNTLTVRRDPGRERDGILEVSVSIFRLMGAEGTACLSHEGYLVMDLTDPAGNPMSMCLWPRGALYNLTVIRSTWPLLEEGTVFSEYEKK